MPKRIPPFLKTGKHNLFQKTKIHYCNITIAPAYSFIMIRGRLRLKEKLTNLQMISLSRLFL